MKFFSLRMLAVLWTGLAGAACVGGAVLQASYVPPSMVAAEPAPATLQAAVALPVTPAAPNQSPAPVPFENRSLLALLPPPESHPHPASHRPAVVEPLPVPPVPPTPPTPLRVARSEAPRHVFQRPAASDYRPAESYAGWGRPLPYPGQYAMERSFYYGGGGYGGGRGPYAW